MPVEIRELIIKTEVRSTPGTTSSENSMEDLNVWRKQLLEECRRMVLEVTKKNKYNR